MLQLYDADDVISRHKMWFTYTTLAFTCIHCIANVCLKVPSLVLSFKVVVSSSVNVVSDALPHRTGRTF